MRILIFAIDVSGNINFGGSGRFMKCVADTLKNMGHEITTDQRDDCDLIIASHYTDQIKDKKARKIFISHGIVKDEAFKKGADRYVSISKEVQLAQAANGFTSDVIAQPIPIGTRKQPGASLRNILIISRKEQQSKGNPFSFLSKHYNVKMSDPTKPIENQIDCADLCITLGRGALESMSRGKPVLVADNRSYMGAIGDGYVTKTNIKEIALNNFSGRRFHIPVTKEWLMSELEKYNPDDSQFLYDYVNENHNHIKIIKQYLKWTKPVNKKIHLVIPFMRYENKEKLIKAYRPMDVILHPVMFQDENIDFNERWIFPAIIPMDSKDCKSKMIECFKRNWFIKNCNINDDDYYGLADDDDSYEDNVFDAIKKLDSEVVVISAKRGHYIPDRVAEVRRYSTVTLFASPDGMQCGMVSAQQLFAKGKVFKKYTYKDMSCWDGDLAEQYKKFHKVEYRPDLYARFNYFEPGRWNNTEEIAEGPTVAFGCMVNNCKRLDLILRNSCIGDTPCFTIMNPETATMGLNTLLDTIEKSGAEIGILSHQDMFYRKHWLPTVKEQIAKLPEDWVIAGIVGKDETGELCGRFHDMSSPLWIVSGHEFPEKCSCIDECTIIVNMKSKFRFESMEGFDLYGTYACMRANEIGSAWIIDAWAEHYCTRFHSEWEPDETFMKMWRWLYDRFPNKRLDSTVLINEIGGD